MTSYRVALCGLGNIAWRFDWNSPEAASPLSHAGAYRKQQKTTLVAGFSPDSNDRDLFSQATGLAVYGRLEEMLVAEKPGIVSICSPTPVHYTQVVTCLEHDIPMIWLEKPPALTSAEVEKLIVKATAKQATVLVNYQRRYLPVYQTLRDRLVTGAMGKCRQIQLNYSRGLETNGSHILDILFFVAGDQAECRLQWVSQTEDAANPSFVLLLAGFPVMVTGAALPYHNIDIAITGDEGRFSVLHGGMTGLVEKKIEHELFPGFYRLRGQADPFTEVAGLTGGMESALLDLLDAHEAKRPPVSNLSSARRTMALIEEVRSQQASGGER